MHKLLRYIVLLSGLILPALLLPGCRQVSDKNVTINGSFANLPGAQLYIYQVLPASRPLIDSVRTDTAGNFSINLAVEKTGVYIIRQNASSEIKLIIEPGEKITLKTDGKPLQNTYTVKGSAHSEVYALYHDFTAHNLFKVDSLSAVFADSRGNPDFQSVKNKLDEAYLEIFNNQKASVVSFVESHLNSLASLLIVSNNFGPNPLISEKTHPELFLKLDSALIQTYPENSLVNSFHLRMLSLKAELGEAAKNDSLFKPGMPAPEIILPNASGENIELSAMKGKLTLVYFWSSWNAQSRQNNISLTTVYNKYHNQGFEIYAVAMDSDKELWQKACLIDKAYWINVIDIKGPGSEYSKLYGVKALPLMVLVGENGNIIARDPEFRELERLIRENI